MIVIACPNCEGVKIKQYEGKMADNGHSWFKCKNCEKSFPLKKASYREEEDIFE